MLTKKEIIKYIISKLDQIISIPVFNKTDKLNEVTYEVQNECKIIFIFDSVLGGSEGKGSFVLSFTMIIENPLLAKIKNLSFNKEYQSDMVLTLNYLKCFPKEWNIYQRYLFSEKEDNKITADRLLEDIKDYFIPYIEPFTGNYELLSKNCKNPEFIKNIGNWDQFVIGVIAALLSKQEDNIEEYLVPIAKSNTNRIEFLEYKKAIDYNEELIEPIKKYITNNMLK